MGLVRERLGLEPGFRKPPWIGLCQELRIFAREFAKQRVIRTFNQLNA